MTEQATVDRLSSRDASLLYLGGSGPGCSASLGIIERGQSEPLTYREFCRVVEDRLVLVPRYRQKARPMPVGLARPVWVDDAGFDIRQHVRRVTVPPPGTPDQLYELVARLSARRLDPRRPLWQLYLIDGLADVHTGILCKTHSALIDGAAVDLMQVLYDPARTPRRVPARKWRPGPEPTDLTLVADALGELVRRPETLWHGLRHSGRTLSTVAGAVTDLLTAASTAVGTAARPAPPSPLNRTTGAQRRFAGLVTDLSDYRAVRSAYQVSVTDVILATVAGGLRDWLMMRGELLDAASVVRTMVPLGVRKGLDDRAVGEGDTRVSGALIDLPVGEANPVVRLHQTAYALHARRQSGHFVRADRLIALSGFAPPTLHALGSKAAGRFSRRLYNLVVSNVPGPQSALYLAGRRLAEAYPVVPLSEHQALAIGVTSYDGGVYYGLNADRESMPDLDVLADLISESLAELVETVK
ncbi:MAG: WS/DGAT/MGAT family O-acyltransferase [Micromonosporaceae bacterium]